MKQLFDSPLVAARCHLDKHALVGAGPAWTWREIHEASLALAQRLGDATAVCNLCSSRVGFLVTWLATLRRRALLILPPSSGNADLASVMKTTTRPVVIVDDPQAIQPQWPDSVECLTWQALRQPAQASDAALAWQPAWDEVAVLLYTSGSTGAPEPQPKTLRQLAMGALVLGRRLSQDVAGGLAAIQRIVCSVPPQHMFGLETSVMLSLVHAIPVLDRRPLLPADVHEAFATSPPGAWIATPLHLRSFVQGDDTVPNCSVVIASTMPLAQALARRTEDLIHAPVLEIYGSTETGVLAMRRSAIDTEWRPVDGVQLASNDDATDAHGSHFGSPVRLLDQLDIGADGRFTLLGRQADLIKIAGRRASLAGLNALLQEMPGLADGVFYLPASGSPTERLCLIHAGPALDRAATRQWLRARLDPAFVPRTLIHVERLPRSDSGKLPRQALDQVYAQWKAGARAATAFQFSVPSDHPALPGHFPGRPIVPGVLLLEQVLTGVGSALKRPVRRLQQVRFAQALLPGETARVAFDSDGERVKFSVTTQRVGAEVSLATGSVWLDAPAAPRHPAPDSPILGTAPCSTRTR
ncbi:MAG TPA: AMP-binding protein [Albitalea sp.]|jgi:acyl-coenzyme A synthetase/AMP-(fatty) acid ligase|nr:AMP-binding protein [Albitalea sp.]